MQWPDQWGKVHHILLSGFITGPNLQIRYIIYLVYHNSDWLNLEGSDGSKTKGFSILPCSFILYNKIIKQKGQHVGHILIFQIYN